MSTILKTYFTDDLIRKIITTILGLIVFTVIYLIINRILKRVTKQKLKPQTATILQKVFKYLYYTLAVIYILGIFDIKVTALFGAAGIAGVAIGFAAQTSFSNIISGFFVLTEHSLKIGDYITVDDVSGTVDSIDMLSIKLKTPDHQMVRIPNETILKANLHNTSYFPTRRLNVTVSVSYNTDLQFALDTLATVPAKCPLVLTDPAPIIFYDYTYKRLIPYQPYTGSIIISHQETRPGKFTETVIPIRICFILPYRIDLYYTAGMAQQKNKAGIAVAAWILIALVLLIVFLIKQDDILRTLKETGFFTHTIGKEPDFIEQYEPEENFAEANESEPGYNEVIIADSEQPVQETSPQLSEQKESVSNPQEENPPVAEEQQEINASTQPEAVQEPEPAAVPPSTTAKLYFVSIGNDGTVSRQESVRTLQKTDSPLTTAIMALLTGPNLEETGHGYMSLIPEGTRLLSAKVSNKTATLNFSEDFEFNRYGVEGYIGQLMQVVYTATAFPTVDNVQFLVEGQKKDYIGSEGVWIGSPLSQSSFK